MSNDDKAIQLLEGIQSRIGGLLTALENLRPTSPSDMLTGAEAAEYLKVGEAQILRFVEMGMEYYEIGKGWKYRRATLDSFAERFRTQKQNAFTKLRACK